MNLLHEQPDMDARYKIFGGLFFISTKLETIGNLYLKDLTIKQWFFLACLTTFFSSPPTVSELAAKMGNSHQNVKQIALRLQEKEFLRIEKDPHDNRTSRLHLAEKFDTFSEGHQKKDAAFIDALFTAFAPEHIQSFLTGIAQMSENLDAIHEDLMAENTNGGV